MITKEELKNYAKIRNLNLGQAEKEYFQNILIFILFQYYGKTLVFKGGTAISKCYGSPRFSEDLDFTSEEKFNTKIIERGLKRFKIEFECNEKEYERGLKITLRIKGPLYNGSRRSLCKLIIDVSFREPVILPPRIKTIGRFLEEIPEFQVYVMHEKEILAEKVRTLLWRGKARDLYDLWFLLKRNIKPDLKLIEKKLEYYNLKFNFKEFREKINSIGNIWESELKPVVKTLPAFEEVKRYVSKHFDRKFKKKHFL